MNHRCDKASLGKRSVFISITPCPNVLVKPPVVVVVVGCSGGEPTYHADQRAHMNRYQSVIHVIMQHQTSLLTTVNNLITLLTAISEHHQASLLNTMPLTIIHH